MEIEEIKRQLSVIAWYRSCSIYCGGDDYYEINVRRNRRATIQSGLRAGIQNAIDRAIENAKAHDDKVKEMTKIKKGVKVNE